MNLATDYISRPLLANLSPLRAIFALHSADIDNELLKGGWVDLAALVAKFPTRVTYMESSVLFKGPVFILPSKINILIVKIAIPIIVGAAATALLLELSKRVFSKYKTDKKTLGNVIDITIFISGVALAALSFGVLNKVMPNQAGIYFL